jgi:alkanesulfonate monooxygenase SsuD/methylene tetrahydromethanopterin reductase-like flavin-dependent oxidoreductase (luciferase family)
MSKLPPSVPPGGMRYSIFSVQDHHPAGDRSVARLYEELARQCVLAETLGYDSFFIAEHHFHEYGVVPNPAIMLAALAQRTTRIRLGPAIAVLPFHHPLTVAENYAMVDALSGGRLVLGVGSGYLRHEFEGYDVDAAEKRDRFDEALSVLRRALSGERITHEGRFWRTRDTAINVPVVQRPAPPIFVAVLRKDAAYHVGRQGHRIIAVPYASLDRFDEVAGMVDEFRRGRAEAGSPAGDDDAIFAFHTHVAESDEEARRRAARPFDLYVETRLYARRQTYDDILRSGLGLLGSVDTVVEKLAALHAMGLRHVMLLQNFGDMAEEHVHRSMRLVAEEAVPRLHRRLGLRR